MRILLQEIRRNPILWLLVSLPVLLLYRQLRPDAHTQVFVLSVLGIVPLATLPAFVGFIVVALVGGAAEMASAIAAARQNRLGERRTA